MANKAPSKKEKPDDFRILKVAEKTKRMEMFWLKGKREELPVYRVPISKLYFNIENGRYADKMVQLRQDNPGVEIDLREEQWKTKIWEMLKGEYPGAEKDKEPFERLKKDLLAREQLHPGVVLNDGGVLDGNRRFAVFTELHKTESNPTRYDYFDAVVLPEDVTAEDRWRIEAGLQIGKDEKLDYSPINRLLKIKEGLKLFEDTNDSAQEIANTLIGISKGEVESDIAKIRLIDQYLEYIGKAGNYGLVSDVMERFEEVANILETAKKAKIAPDDLALLRLKLFTSIRFKTMDNWKLREIKAALGVSGRGQSGRRKNEKALKGFLAVDDKKMLKKALVENDAKSDAVTAEKERADTFIDAMEVADHADEPFRLGERAQRSLEQLKETLDGGIVAGLKNWTSQEKKLQGLLDTIGELTKACIASLKKVKK